MDKRQRSKIPIKPKPSVRWLLENATGPQLDFLRRMADGEDFKDFLNLIGKFKHYNVYAAFEYKAIDDRDLAINRAYRKGEVGGLEDLVIACQLAKEEQARRKKDKNG